MIELVTRCAAAIVLLGLLALIFVPMLSDDTKLFKIVNMLIISMAVMSVGNILLFMA